MSDLRKAAELALTALDTTCPNTWHSVRENLRKALAHQEQGRLSEITRQFVGIKDDGSERWVETEYYTVTRGEWLGLTDEEIDDLWQMAQAWNPPKHFYLLIDAKLRQKNNCHASLVSIQQLNLPVRVFEALHADGVRTIGQLSQMAPFEIKRIPGIGKKAYKDIKDALARFKENE